MEFACLVMLIALVSLGSATQLKVVNEDEEFPFHYCGNLSSADQKCFDGSFSQKECRNISLQIDLKNAVTVRLISSGQTLFSIPMKNALYLNEYLNKIFDKRPVPPMIFVKTINANGSTDTIFLDRRVTLLDTIPLDSTKPVGPGLDVTCGRLVEVNVIVPNDIDEPSFYKGHPAIFMAIIWGDIDAVKTIIRKVPNATKIFPVPVLHIACMSCNTDLLKYFIDQGEKELVSLSLESPLMGSVEYGCLNNARLLLKDRTLDPKDANLRNSNVLHVASKHHDYPELVDLLISLGANITEKDRQSLNALHLAAINGHRNVVKKLIERGVPVDVKDDQGRTPLMLAAKNGKKSCVEELIALGADVESVDSNGRSVMQYAQGYPLISESIKSKLSN